VVAVEQSVAALTWLVSDRRSLIMWLSFGLALLSMIVLS